MNDFDEGFEFGNFHEFVGGAVVGVFCGKFRFNLIDYCKLTKQESYLYEIRYNYCMYLEFCCFDSELYNTD
ncbi:hypothetical protein GCM10009007_03660 [Formosimonas limnophila]|uniref:Uncharacterized protein n=1 Tax=Formosimonas limnophila TaxID=1384487 RepID=A0A8J3CJT4_9BURK|nr:hypothetical protein GCM10009007_03660 [Formosimonas limnophila]